MIDSGVIFLVGALILSLALTFRKSIRARAGTAWLVSFLAGGVALILCGGTLFYGNWEQYRERREAVYLSLKCIESRETDSAAYFLKKTGSADNFVTAAAHYLLERTRGNDLIARLNLDIARSVARPGPEASLLAELEGADVGDDGVLSGAAGALIDLLRISRRRQDWMNLYLQAQSGGAVHDEETLRNLGLDETTLSRLTVGRALQARNYELAVRTAAQLVDRKPSEENQLLLAETVAQSAYGGGAPLSDDVFFYRDGDGARNSVRAERQALERRREKLEQLLSETAEDRAEQRMKLTEQIQKLRDRDNYLYVYRALNAVSGLYSLKAQITRARLHFAAREYREAVETLLGASRSPIAMLTANQTVAGYLRMVGQSYRDDSGFYESLEFQDAVTQMLSAPFDDLMYVSRSPLTEDFMRHIVGDLKTYGQDLFLSEPDVSAYPRVTVTLSGQEELLKRVVAGEDVFIRDTMRSVTRYEAVPDTNAETNICVVVDRSSSMQGTRMENLKAALDTFVRNMSRNTPVSLVAFDDGAERLTDLTRDQAELLMTIRGDGMNTRNATNIADGVRVGLETLSAAGGVSVMLLMTDGQDTHGLQNTAAQDALIQDALSAHVTIHTIGFGEADEILLSRIAEGTGGEYLHADASSELSNVYASLQGIIGHMVTLEYTVPEEEISSQPRYVYVTVGGSSVRREYSTVRRPEDVRVDVCSPPVLPRAASGASLTLSGEGLKSVVSLTVGGLPAEIVRQEDDALSVRIESALPAGWQELRVRTGEAEKAFPRLLLVGDTQTYRNLRLRSLFIASAEGVVLREGGATTLVLAGERIPVTEAVSRESSLSLSVQGLLMFPWQEQAGIENNGTVDFGESHLVTGAGIVSLNASDSAYAPEAPRVVARGEFVWDCEPEQSRLTQISQGGF